MLPFALFGLIALALCVLWPPRGEHAVAASRTDDGAPAANSAGAARAPAGPHPADEVGRSARASRWWGQVRRDPLAGVLFVFGGWFLVEALIMDFSKGIIHPYYISALGPGSAAMIAGGALAFARFGRARDPRVLLLPLAVAATIAVQLVLLHREHYAHWLAPLLIAGTAAGVLALLAVRRLATAAMALVLGVLLIAPTAFSTTTWSVPVEGTFPAAGPRVAGSLGPYGITHHDVRVYRDLMRYIDARHPTRKWEVLTVSSNTSASIILLGWRAGAVGGYSGTDPALNGPGLARPRGPPRSALRRARRRLLLAWRQQGHQSGDPCLPLHSLPVLAGRPALLDLQPRAVRLRRGCAPAGERLNPMGGGSGGGPALPQPSYATTDSFRLNARANSSLSRPAAHRGTAAPPSASSRNCTEPFPALSTVSLTSWSRERSRSSARRSSTAQRSSLAASPSPNSAASGPGSGMPLRW